MNQDQLKEILLKIEQSEEFFSVVFSGKSSKKVNGLYKPENNEIIIHNKNMNSDNEIITTGIHEYAHHLQYTVHNPGVFSRVHSNTFWTIYHKLLDKAEALNIIQNNFRSSDEFKDLTDKIKTKYLYVNSSLMLELSGLLKQASDLCVENNLRFDDYVERELCVPRTFARTLLEISVMNVKADIPFESLKSLSKIKDKVKQQEAISAMEQGLSPEIIKSEYIHPKKVSEDPAESLLQEKIRIEKTILRLKNKLDQIEMHLEKIDVQ